MQTVESSGNIEVAVMRRETGLQFMQDEQASGRRRRSAVCVRRAVDRLAARGGARPSPPCRSRHLWRLSRRRRPPPPLMPHRLHRRRNEAS